MATPDSVTLRRFVYDEILSRGQPPTAKRIGDHFGIGPSDAKRRLAALKIGKTVLAHPETGEIWMAGPFAASATPYRVVGAHQMWWANCAWDMLGVAVIANEPVRIDASCTDCKCPVTLVASPERGVESRWVVHFLLPARQWYDDIGYT